MPAWLIWIIVIVVVVVVVAALVAMTRKRRNEQRRVRAEELREEASTHAAVLPEAQRQAEELRAKADLAQAEARRAEERAANAEQGHRVEQASYEDKVREADRLDPEVDHKSGDYEPDVWNDERSETGTTPESPVPTSGAPGSPAAATGTTGTTGTSAEVTQDEPGGPRHAASPDDVSVAQRTEDPEAESAASTSQTRRDTT